MAYSEWSIEGREFVNCNCAYGCPCQFNALPTDGYCEAVQSIQIDRGSFEGVSLDGLRVVLLAQWPGPIHEGNGQCQPIVDERADDAQRDAILKIVSGEETEPGKTVWHVFSTTMTQVHEPIFAPIELDIDVDARLARLSVPGLVDASGEPIRNPVTGEEHRARIDLPNGFEYLLAEVGSGSAKTTGTIALDLNDSYGQFARIHLTQNGVPT